MKTLLIILGALTSFQVLATGVCTSELDISRELVKYFDRNKDGKPDVEYHEYSCLSHSDWELRDDNYDGFFELKMDYGLVPFASEVNVIVPEGVKFEPEYSTFK